jgi:hypothetical protein
MSTLGEILGRLQDPSAVHQLMAEAGDVAVTVPLDKRAGDNACDPSQIALRAVDDFTRKADDEAWVKLIGRVQDAEAPAAACLNEMIRWALAR